MKYKNIVCGVTGSACAKKAALEAARLARSENADLTYVYAVDSGFLKSGKAGGRLTEESLEQLGRHILENAVQTALAEQVTARMLITKGSFPDVLKRVIQEQKADLLVLAHEEKTFSEKHFLEGDIANYIEMLKKETGVDVSLVEYMGEFVEQMTQTLGVRFPGEYAGFIEKYGKRLSSDPVAQESWITGLGAADFVVGTTLAFRSNLPGFRLENVVIGYAGMKTIIVDKRYEEIDEYFMLDTRDGSILTVDSLGAANLVATGFEEWITPELLRATLREKYTSNLTVVVFDDSLKAEEARLKLLQLQKDGFLELEDSVVVVKEQDGTVRYNQMHKMARRGGIAGSITGLIVGSIFFTPLIGAALGAITGAISASLSNAGIDDKFMKDLSRDFKPGSSALFTLVRKADVERVRESFLGFGGKILVNSVSKDNEAAIQELLDATPVQQGQSPE